MSGAIASGGAAEIVCETRADCGVSGTRGEFEESREAER